MSKTRNALIAGIALIGLGIGSAQAAPLDIDTINVDLNLSVGSFNPGQVCVSEFECSFNFLPAPIDEWVLTGGSNGFGGVDIGDLFTGDLFTGVGGDTLDPPPFGFFDLDLDDGSQLYIDLIEFGTDAGFSAFEFIGTINTAAGVAGVGSEFLSFGDTVGIVLTMASVLTENENSWDANIVNIQPPPPQQPPQPPQQPPTVTTVPEPSTLLLLGLGLAGLSVSRRSKRA